MQDEATLPPRHFLRTIGSSMSSTDAERAEFWGKALVAAFGLWAGVVGVVSVAILNIVTRVQDKQEKIALRVETLTAQQIEVVRRINQLDVQQDRQNSEIQNLQRSQQGVKKP